ncbi:unnamed protein product [Closterium sp. NIES-65]|nr:unnamed protein product [Closterium sp. NIES-65]
MPGGGGGGGGGVCEQGQEPIKWDLEEMERHLAEPNFNGEPAKVAIFYSWFDSCFYPLVRSHLEHRDKLLLPALTERIKERPPNEVSAPLFQAIELMDEVKHMRADFDHAQMDDRPNVAEVLRQKLTQLSRIFHRQFDAEMDFYPSRVRHAFMPTEAESILVEAESHVGFFLASTRLPWIFHGLERWASPGKPEKFLEQLPWVHRLLLEYWWEPVYLRCNWLLLQSLADPVEEDKL